MTSRFVSALSIALAAMFFGIAFYINVAEQHARLGLPDAALLAEWKVSYSVGIRVQATLAILTGLAGLAAWWFRRDWRWMAGGLLMLANWPWTLVMIAPINATLNETASGAAGSASRALIEQWGNLHAVRTLFGLAAAALFVWAAVAANGPLSSVRER